jgi:hypothetical protein
VSLTQNELIYVMAYVDGQVDDDEMPEVLEMLEKNEDARMLAAELGAVGDWVRSSSDERAIRGKADGIVELVMEEAEQLGGGKVITLERERARRALNRQRVKEFGAILAVAAVFAFLWSRPNAPMPGEQGMMVAAHDPNLVSPGASPMPRPPENAPPPSPSGAAPTREGAETGTALAVGSEEGVDIESVESPHQVSVFYLPLTNKNAASVVVWIGEPEEVH